MNAQLASPDSVDSAACDVIPACADIALLRVTLAVLGVPRSLAEVVLVAQQFPAEQRNLLELRDMLALLGVAGEGRALPASAMDTAAPPVIALLDSSGGPRFMLVRPADDAFALFDGVAGWHTCSAAQLAARWRGAVLTLAAMPLQTAPAARIRGDQDRLLRDYARQQVRVVEQAFDPQLCAEVMRSAAAGFAPSRVGGERDAGWRSVHRSSSSSMVGRSHPHLHRELAARAATLVPELAAECFELAQCVRYGTSEQYRPHLDVPAPLPQAASGQRTWTVLVYLNDDFEGGETSFPLLDLSVQPRRGTALIFRNRDALGLANVYTLHAGQPVHRGVKYACNLWASTPP